MALTYGFLKGKIVSDVVLKPSRHGNETQYHLHSTVAVTAADGSNEEWDTAINVGTNAAQDLLKYKLVSNFQHPVVDTLKTASSGFSDLTGTGQLPALDFLRSDVLTSTSDWQDSDVMNGSTSLQPVAALLSALNDARDNNLDVYLFGRKYTDGLGIHDVHMNQGSQGSYLNNGVDDHNDHNDIWQDGGVIVDAGQPQVTAYFTVFTQQLVPTDNLGNPTDNSHPVGDADDGSLMN